MTKGHEKGKGGSCCSDGEAAGLVEAGRVYWLLATGLPPPSRSPQLAPLATPGPLSTIKPSIPHFFTSHHLVLL